MWLPLACLLLGTWPATQACALTGNGIRDLLDHRLALNPVSHTSQGSYLKSLGMCALQNFELFGLKAIECIYHIVSSTQQPTVTHIHVSVTNHAERDKQKIPSRLVLVQVRFYWQMRYKN